MSLSTRGCGIRRFIWAGVLQLVASAPISAAVRLVVREEGAPVYAHPDEGTVPLRHCLEAESIEVLEKQDGWLRVHDGWVQAARVVEAKQALHDFSRSIGDLESACLYACRARAHIELRRLPEAFADATHALELDIEYPPAWYNRGAARAAAGDVEGGSADFQEAIRLLPTYGAAHRALGTALMVQCRYPEAVVAYDAAIANGAGDSVAFGNRGICRASSGDYRLALEDLAVAIDACPGESLWYANRASLYLAMRRLEDAQADVNRALANDGASPKALVVAASVSEQRGQLEEALRCLKRAIDADPNMPDAYACRAQLHLNHRDFDAAMADAQHALLLNPRAVDALRIRGAIDAKRGETDAAIRDLDDALRLSKYHVPSYVTRASIFFMIGEYGKARDDMRQAVGPNKFDAANQGSLAWILATCPDEKVRDGRAALNAAKSACMLTDYRDAANLEDLAAACAETGDFSGSKFG